MNKSLPLDHTNPSEVLRSWTDSPELIQKVLTHILWNHVTAMGKYRVEAVLPIMENI